MKQCLAALTVSLALLGVLTGSLLRPCDCGARAGPARDATWVRTGSPCAACCCSESETQTRSKSGDQPSDDSCKLCCKPAPPAVEASSAVVLAPPALAGVLAIRSPAPDLRSTCVMGASGSAAPPDCTQWRLTEEGLAVFRL